jgi:hypothetical protein
MVSERDSSPFFFAHSSMHFESSAMDSAFVAALTLVIWIDFFLVIDPLLHGGYSLS